jgi:hypothetical protein
LITAASLKEYTLRDLAQMAKRKGVQGWHSMRKDDLVRALVKAARTKSSTSNGKKRAASNGKKSAASNGKKPVASNGKKPAASNGKGNGRCGKTVGKVASANGSKAESASGKGRGKTSSDKGTGAQKPAAAKETERLSTVARRIHRKNASREKLRDLSSTKIRQAKRPTEDFRDRVVLLVRDAYWLHAHWRFTRQTVSRAQAALAEQWHTAKPILRLLEVNGGSTTSTAERVARDIEIHGGVNNWYIDIKNSPKSFRVDVGYLAANGRFYSLGRSNTVTTPRPGNSDVLDEDWSELGDDYDRIYAMSGGFEEMNVRSDLQELFEEQLRRPMGAPAATRYGAGASRVVRKGSTLDFKVDADVIIYGQVKTGSYITLAGEPVKLRPDGTFTVRMSMPDQRQILPVVAQSSDGIEQRTTVLSINRNTKKMEPVFRDPSE